MWGSVGGVCAWKTLANEARLPALQHLRRLERQSWCVWRSLSPSDPTHTASTTPGPPAPETLKLHPPSGPCQHLCPHKGLSRVAHFVTPV